MLIYLDGMYFLSLLTRDMKGRGYTSTRKASSHTQIMVIILLESA